MMNFYKLNQKIQEDVETESEAGPYYPERPEKGFLSRLKDALSGDILSPVLGPEFNQGMNDGLEGKAIKDRDNERYYQGWLKGYRIHVCKKRPDLC
jgi:hypothetical protein